MKGRILIILLISFLGLSLLAQNANPFDIIRSATDTVVPVESATEAIVTKLEGDNPFSVSHIPIRKNQFKEIERLAITDKVEENIALSSLPLVLIIISLCVMAFIIFRKKDHVTILIRSLANDNFLKMTKANEGNMLSINYILGYLLFFINIALFFFLAISKYFRSNYTELTSRYELGEVSIFMMILGLCFMFFFGKHLLNTFFSWVYRLPKEARLYDFTIITFRNLLGVIFLMINILFVFGPEAWIQSLLVLGLVIYIILLLSRHYKGVRIGGTWLNNYFVHFFIYFCAFEICPWVITFTLVRDFI